MQEKLKVHNNCKAVFMALNNKGLYGKKKSLDRRLLGFLSIADNASTVYQHERHLKTCGLC